MHMDSTAPPPYAPSGLHHQFAYGSGGSGLPRRRTVCEHVPLHLKLLSTRLTSRCGQEVGGTRRGRAVTSRVKRSGADRAAGVCGGRDRSGATGACLSSFWGMRWVRGLCKMCGGRPRMCHGGRAGAGRRGRRAGVGMVSSRGGDGVDASFGTGQGRRGEATYRRRPPSERGTSSQVPLQSIPTPATWSAESSPRRPVRVSRATRAAAATKLEPGETAGRAGRSGGGRWGRRT